MKKMRIHALSVILLLPAVPASAATIAAVGTYDEQATQTNAVDVSAAFSAGTGNGTSANVQTFATFDTAVESAFTAGTGGVLDFDSQMNIDDQVPTTGIDSSIGITFDSAARTFNLGYALTSGENLFRQGNLSNRTPISAGNGSTPGFAATTEDEDPGALTLTLGGITGGGPLEAVTQFGFTFLSRTSRDFGVVSATALFSGGGSVTANFDNTVFTAGSQDMFFGFVAPAGESISSVSLSVENEFQYSIDDIGFVTGVIPEPGTFSLLLIALCMLATRRRRG